MDNKDKIKNLGKLPNRPYAVWLLILLAITALVMLPRNQQFPTQQFDSRKLMNAAANDELVEISMQEDSVAGKDWYIVNGKIKNPVFGKENAPKDAPRALDFSFKEIAKERGSKENTIKTRYHRALRKLRKEKRR